MIDDETLTSLADPRLEQHFLTSPRKIQDLLIAADIRTGDRVIELGAGVGTIAQHFPPDIALTLVELDHRLVTHLRTNVPHAQVHAGDALKIALTQSFDVLIGSLPNAVTEKLLAMLSKLNFRTAVLAIGSSTDPSRFRLDFEWFEVTRMTGDDFTPPQPEVSRLVKITPRGVRRPAAAPPVPHAS